MFLKYIQLAKWEEKLILEFLRHKTSGVLLVFLSFLPKQKLNQGDLHLRQVVTLKETMYALQFIRFHCVF